MGKENKRLCVCTMYCDGKSINEIAEFLGVSTFIVKSAINRMLERGSINDLPRPGRNKKNSKRDKRHIKYMAMRNLYYSAGEIVKEGRYYHGINTNRNNVRSILSQYGFKRYPDRIAPRMNDEWMRSRRQFNMDNLDTDWNRVIFTDEKTFSLTSNGRLKYYARSYEEFQEKHHNVPLNINMKVKVWGAISCRGLGPLLQITESMNTHSYVENILEPLLSTRKSRNELMHFCPSYRMNLIWQQDNAPFHNGEEALTFLKDHNIEHLRWPTYSPDLSPIENVWNQVQYKVRIWQIEHGQIAPNNDLFQLIEQAWNSITPVECKALVCSMPDRLNELFRRHYNIIDY